MSVDRLRELQTVFNTNNCDKPGTLTADELEICRSPSYLLASSYFFVAGVTSQDTWQSGNPEKKMVESLDLFVVICN